MAPAPGGFARINAAVTQQKGHGALPGPALHADGVLSGPGQVPHGFVVGVGHLNRGEFSGPQQPGQGQGVPAVVFQTVAGAPGDQGGGGHQAAMALGRQMPVDLVAARSGLISEAQFGALGLEFPGHLVQGLQVAADPPVKSDLGTRTWLGNGHIHGHFMDIQPHIKYALSHGLPPWLWLCAVSRSAHSLTHVARFAGL